MEQCNVDSTTNDRVNELGESENNGNAVIVTRAGEKRWVSEKSGESYRLRSL